MKNEDSGFSRGRGKEKGAGYLIGGTTAPLPANLPSPHSGCRRMIPVASSAKPARGWVGDARNDRCVIAGLDEGRRVTEPGGYAAAGGVNYADHSF
ncbi:MAG: hypothetical protein HP497_13135 [Nitrospira sp.]|nr:hypothetical protein [Nitrospira sp.]